MRYLIAMFVTLAAFAGTATAAEVVASGDLDELIQPVLQAASAGNWPWALAGALVLVTALMRRYGAKRWPWFATGPGAAILLLVGSFAASLATAFAAGSGMSWHLAKAALGVAVTAAGGYSLVKTLVLPMLLNKLGGRFGWLDAALGLLLKVFPDKAEKAKMAGDKAVAANPPTGLQIPRDVP